MARRYALPPSLVERVLDRLGLAAAPALNLTGLSRLYDAWCRRVPFDNVRKLIHLRSGLSGPLPGDEPRDFFEAWLQYGAGGTCWAGNGALQALLRALSFDAERGIGTMLVAPNLPPNHGTVVVRLDSRRYLVDASLLSGQPLLLSERSETGVEHGAWGVQCRRRARHWHVRWRPLHQPLGIECRIECLRASGASFHEWHERSRPWSPFNYSVYARSNRGDATVGIAFGRLVELGADGSVRQADLTASQRAQFLVERLGLDAALIARLPPDLPTPPPPRPAGAAKTRAPAAG